VRPEPLGGEIALRLSEFDKEERAEPFTYNEWWRALTLERKFKGDWSKCRQAIAKRPAAAAKQAIPDRLQERQTEDAEYLDMLSAEFSPSAKDYHHTEKWFDHQPVSEARAG